MKSNKRKERADISRKDAMRCIAIKNPEVIETRLDSGVIMISYPVKAKPWIAKLADRLAKNKNSTFIKKLELDELGTKAWDMINGTRTVEDIINVFAEDLQLHKREAEASVTQFIRELGKRGLIGLK